MNQRSEAIKARLAAATPGPWRQVGNTVFIDQPGARDNRYWALPGDPETAELIANAPTDLAWCLEQIELLERGRAAWEAVALDGCMPESPHARWCREQVAKRVALAASPATVTQEAP